MVGLYQLKNISISDTYTTSLSLPTFILPFCGEKIGALIRSCLYQVSNSASLHLILSCIGTKVGVDSDFTLRPKMGENCHKRHLHKISYSFDIILLHSVELFYIWSAQTNPEFSQFFRQSDSHLIGENNVEINSLKDANIFTLDFFFDFLN